MGVYFDSGYEQESIDAGIASRQQEVGVTVQWWFWDAKDSEVDDVYDEGIPGRSLHWRGPFLLPVYQVHRVEGTAVDAGDGSYGVDNIQLVLGYAQATRAGLVPAVDRDRLRTHLKDRFIFDGKVWSPSSIVAHNKLGGRGTRATIIVEATEVRDDELVNDTQFAKYAEADYVDPNPGFVAR